MGLAGLWLTARFRFPPFLALSASSGALGRQRPRVLSVHTQKRCAMGPRQKRLLVRFSHSRFTLSPLPSHSQTTASQHAAGHSSLPVNSQHSADLGHLDDKAGSNMHC